MAADDFAGLFARGRVLLQNEDARALSTLQRAVDASQNATKLDQVAAVLALSRAAQKWRSRDDAVEVLARGLQQNDAKEIRQSLASLLIDGLPQNASEKTLQTLSQIASRGQWTLQKSVFSLSSFNSLESARANSFDILHTRGELFVNGQDADGAPQLWLTPKLYAAYSNLPPTLQMNRALYGYVRRGENWRQVARVLYANVEGENARAQKICDGFLRVWCSFYGHLQRDNLYANVTTIWLSRESALWPQSENTPNWNAGAQLDSAPGEMILFRTGEVRSDAEWLREIAHEYSHISWPPFAGYKLPLEPFGNGAQGETLFMLWALQNPSSFLAPNAIDEATQQLRVHVARHAVASWKRWTTSDARVPIIGDDEVARQKLQGLTLWIERVYGNAVLENALKTCDDDEQSRLKQRESALSLALRRNGNAANNVLRASMLQGAAVRVLDVQFAKQKTLKIWLGGVLSTSISADNLAVRAPLKLTKNQQAVGWIYLPRGAKSLRIETSTLFSIKGWKTSFANNVVVLMCEDKTGWQRLSFGATQNCEVNTARFE